MKAICVKKRDWSNLTIGKTYNVIRVYRDDNVYCYEIINDVGDKAFYAKGFFSVVRWFRNDKINKLLD